MFRVEMLSLSDEERERERERERVSCRETLLPNSKQQES